MGASGLCLACSELVLSGSRTDFLRVKMARQFAMICFDEMVI
jgi:hypothetical protein